MKNHLLKWLRREFYHPELFRVIQDDFDYTKYLQDIPQKVFALYGDRGIPDYSNKIRDLNLDKDTLNRLEIRFIEDSCHLMMIENPNQLAEMIMKIMEQKSEVFKYRIMKLKDCPERKEEAANWFHGKWGVPVAAYIESMDASLTGDKIQEWYLCLDGDKIIAGMGVIENDFHDKKELSPNICAVYTEKEYRGQGIAGKLLNYVVEDNRAKGISPIYLITDHTGFYERYGWEFFCMAQDEGKSTMGRLYIHV